MKFRLRHADKFVGLFFIVALVFLFTALIVVGSNQRWFSRDIKYASRFPTAVGLSRNLSVRLSGFEIGKVLAYELTGDNYVDVELVIYEEYLDRIRYGSVLELKSNPLGLSSELALYPGVSGQQTLGEGSFIPRIGSAEGRSLVEQQLVDMPDTSDPIAAVMDSIEPLLEELQTTIRLVNNTLASVDVIARAFAHAVEGEDARPLGRVMENIAGTTATIEQLLRDLETPDGIVRRLLGADGSIATLLDDGNQMYESIYRSLLHAEDAMSGVADLGQGLGSTSPQLSVLMMEILATVEETRKVMEGVRNNPLLRGGVQQERDSVTNQTGYRDGDF